MAITIASANPNVGEDTYVVPTNALKIWLYPTTIATDLNFRGTSTGAPSFPMAAATYIELSGRGVAGQTLYFQSAGNSTVGIMVETGLNS